MQCPLVRAAKNQLSVSAIDVAKRVSELLFVWQTAEMNEWIPACEPCCSREERAIERRVRAEIEQRRPARCPRKKSFELGAGKFCRGRPIRKPKIPPTAARRQIARAARDGEAVQGREPQRARRGVGERFLAQHRLAIRFAAQRKTCLGDADRRQLITEELLFQNRHHVERKPDGQAAMTCCLDNMPAHQGQNCRRLRK